MMNRRRFVASGAILATQMRNKIAHSAAPEEPHPIDFLRREFLHLDSNVASTEVRVLQSSAYDFAVVEEIPTAISLLMADAQDSNGFEISIGEAFPIASPVFDQSPGDWFVTYTTWAGVAAFEVQHAQGIFAIGNRVFDISAGGDDPEVLASLLKEQVHLIRTRSGGLPDVLPMETDLPEGLVLYREETPDGIFDAGGNRVEEPDPTWRNPMQLIGMSRSA